jgi:S1-C subfamily serine protease
MTRRSVVALALLMLLPLAAGATPRVRETRPDPATMAAEPSYVRRVTPSIVGLRVRADEHALSSTRLGSRRFGSAAIFDERGYALTVTYVLMDAVEVEAQLRDGRTVPARVVGLDLETGLGVVQLTGAGPWPAAPLGQSRDARSGMLTATVGVDEDNDLVWVASTVQGVRRFSGFWEYMLDRALMVSPGSPSWGGSVIVDAAGAVVGVASLRLGEPPYVNVAIPIEKFVPVKDELIATGRVASRRSRPWLGIYTQARPDGVFVDGFSPAGPAAQAGFRRGDRIVGVNGVAVRSQEEFYEQLWRGQAGDVIRVAVQREDRTHVIAVGSVDRYRLLRAPNR